MGQSSFKNELDELLKQRSYYEMFKIIERESNDFLTNKIDNYNLCVELINLNQDLLEYMGASKEFEMAFELHNKLMQNRNSLFISCIPENKKELIEIFKRCVGDTN